MRFLALQNNIQTKTFAMELGTLAPLIQLLATDDDDMVNCPPERSRCAVM